jgi:hypothetical protein
VSDVRPLRCKGTNLKGVSEALARLEGPEVFERVVAAAPPTLQDILRTGIKPHQWYDLSLYRALHASIHEVVARPTISRDLAREATRHDFRGVFRLFITVFKPETVLTYSTRLWRLYCDGGEVLPEREAPSQVRITYTGLVGFNRHLFDDAVGGTEAVLEVAGAEKITSRVLSGGKDGDDGMVTRLSWRG